MAEWIEAEFPTSPGKYLRFKDGEIRVAEFDGYGWIESIDFVLHSKTTHWAVLPKDPVQLKKEWEEYSNSSNYKALNQYIENFLETFEPLKTDIEKPKDD